MHGVLEPFAEPVHGEGDVDDQTNDAGGAAAAGAVGAGRVDAGAVRLVGDVDGDKRNGEPGGEGDGH